MGLVDVDVIPVEQDGKRAVGQKDQRGMLEQFGIHSAEQSHQIQDNKDRRDEDRAVRGVRYPIPTDAAAERLPVEAGVEDEVDNGGGDANDTEHY